MFITSPSFLRRAAVPAVGLAAGFALAVSAADGQTGRTIVFTGPSGHDPREYKQTDVRPRGLSIGDQFLVAGSLRKDGRVVGRANVVCTVVDRRYEGQDCAFVLILADGTITASGGGLNRLLPGQAPPPPHAPDEYGITGGTGAYRGASGTLSMHSHADDTTTLTLSL
jgi:hypothetical protein